MSDLLIGFAGLTHLGLNSLAAAAERGFKVLGFDENSETVKSLLAGQISINEDGLNELLIANNKKISFSCKPTALRNCDIVYISVDVPTDDNANSDLVPIEAIINVVLEAITYETLLVILCQVPPGFTRKIQKRHFNTYYQVETLIFGRAVERALYPERHILGCANAEVVDARLLTHLEAYDCPVLPMKFESAELCKTAINIFLAASVSTANSLADVCERIGADWSEIIPSLRLDRRIGQYAYIETGLGLSGGNIERDLRTVQSLGFECGADSSVIESFINHSRYRKNWIVEKFKTHTKNIKSPKVGVLGLSYKENTHSIKNSPSVAFLENINEHEVQVYDPIVKSLPKKFELVFCKNAYEAAAGADIVLINTPWDEFRLLDIEQLISSMHSKIIIDPFNVLFGKLPCNINHVTLGRR